LALTVSAACNSAEALYRVVGGGAGGANCCPCACAMTTPNATTHPLNKNCAAVIRVNFLLGIDLVRVSASIRCIRCPAKNRRPTSQLILSCQKTGQVFNSGFEATADDLRFVPPKWTAKFFCRICAKVHDFDFAEARICECPHKCPAYGACQNCEFSRVPDQTAA